MYTKTKRNGVYLQTDTHGFTDHFARVEMFVGVEFVVSAIEIFVAK